MALSGSTSQKISNTSGTPNEYLVLSWVVNSQSVANNTSNITVTLKAYSTYGSGAQPWNLAGNTVRLTVGGSQKVNDTNASIDFRGTSASSPVTLATWTGNVTHSSDGTLSLALSGYIYYNDTETSHSGLPGAHTITATASIDTIARASRPTCPASGSFGSAIKVTTNRASSSFTHTLVFSCNGHSKTITGVDADYTYTIPASWAPTANANSQTLTVTCTTYSGSTSLGSNTCTSTISVPSSWKPSVSINYTKTNAADNGDVLASVTTVNLTASGSGSNGSTISSYAWSGSASGSGATKSYTQSSAGSYTYTCTVTDSRGRTGSASVTVTVVSAISSFTKNKTSMNFGDSITVTITRKKTSFTHSVSYKVGSTSVGSSSNVATSDTKTIAASSASTVPNASSGTLTITVTTYNGSTSLGSTSQTVTINVPSTWLPSISSFTASGVSQFNSLYLTTVSKVKWTVSASASTGATISSYKITGQNLNYTGSSNNATSDTLTASGSKTYTVVVTDSRGRSATTTASITVTSYASPKITMTGHRCNQDGTANDFGEYAQMYVSGTWSSVSGNKWSLTIKYRGYGSQDAYSTIQSLSNQTASPIAHNSTIFSADVDTAYEVVATVTDSVGKSSTYTVNISTGRVLEDHYKDRLNTFHRTASAGLLSDLGNPDLANVFAGETWYEGALRGRIAGINSRAVFILPYLTPTILGSETSIADTYQKALAWICVNYPNVTHGTWIGEMESTSTDDVNIHIFNTNTVDANGAPRFASVHITKYDGTVYVLGYSDYVWYMQRLAPYESGTWTPKIYDSETYKYSLAANSATWFKSGDIILCRGEYSAFTPSSAISTMFQIRGFPTMRILGGTFYLAGLSGAGGDRTIQPSNIGLYLRPNIKLTSGTNYGLLAFSFYGV